jgi:hypothetical protein
MLRALAAAGAALLLQAASASGEEFGNDRFLALAKECRAQAAVGPSAAALRIRDAAVAQHKSFQGNRVDHTGRIVFFGHSEVESDHEGDDSFTADKVPWRRVLRYWEAVTGEPAATAPHRTLGAWYYPGALDNPPPAELDRRGVSLRRLLEVIDKLDFSEFGDRSVSYKAAIQQSVIRASLSDVAWSAAFVSFIMRDAGLEEKVFAYGAAHVAYISAAVAQSLRDGNGGERTHFFRACDPALTPPRAGDLLCYHRHTEGTRNPYVPKGPSLFRSIFEDFASGERPIIRSHCDIVVDVDARARKVTVIGGNVQNSVTERVLTLNKRGVLSMRQGTKACGPNNPDSLATGGANCNFNDQKWFVLLQAVM